MKAYNRAKKRACWIESHICHIPLQDGTIAICDEDRIEEVNSYSWTYSFGYAKAKINKKSIALHRFLYPNISMIDHINRNTRDNRSCNLREATDWENRCNRSKYKNTSSKYRGVCIKIERNKPFASQITHLGKTIHIGFFSSEEEAAIAYDAMAQKLRPDNCVLNFPKEVQS